MKRILKSESVQRVLAALIAAYIRLVFRLTRWTLVDPEPFQAPARAGTPFIVCFWHGRMVMMPPFWPYSMPLYLLGSPHRDGQLILRVLRHFGVRSVVGSSTRGGTRALREMVQRIREGSSICLAPDGPRGPRMQAAPGIIALSKLAGVPIVPIAVSVTRGRLLETWDRFLLALPFGRGVFVAGAPLSVPDDADDTAIEAARLALEARLNEITAEADRRCGRAPVAPAVNRQPASAEMAETGA